ncbi:MAG: hypothetical protein CMF49_00045 [Legionellales bacterium]|nr:hypothetical protein [Legionellales bacterium]|tara:strand:- start:1109 stop:1921 length:813 start_codon:yes stop_codon:yes gene_type:complete
MRNKICLFFLVSAFLSIECYAGDGAGLAYEIQTATNTATSAANSTQSVTDLENQLTVLNNQYTELQKQLGEAKEIYNQGTEIKNQAIDIQNDLNGSGSYSSLLGDTQQLLNQAQWTKDDWDDALKGLSGGNQERYNELVTEYQSQYQTVQGKPVDDSKYKEGASDDNAAMHKQDVAVNQTVYASSSYEYANLNTIAKSITDIGNEIDQADTTKKALDLQAKLSEQMALIQLEMLKMQTINNEQAAEAEARTLNEQSQQAVYISNLDKEAE